MVSDLCGTMPLEASTLLLGSEIIMLEAKSDLDKRAPVAKQVPQVQVPGLWPQGQADFTSQLRT